MTPDQRTAVDCVLFILRRKPNQVPLAEEQYLSIGIDDLELDSIDRLDMVMELERRFDVVFTTSAVVKCKTIDEILAVVRSERARRAEQSLE